MTKREELQAKTHQIIENNLRVDNGEAWLTLEGLYEVFTYLHSQNVVMKMDRNFPVPYTPIDNEQNLNTEFALDAKMQREIIKEAGFVVVEPLIKEAK